MKKKKRYSQRRCEICDLWFQDAGYLCGECQKAIDKELKPKKDEEEILVDANDILKDEFYRRHGILRITDR